MRHFLMEYVDSLLRKALSDSIDQLLLSIDIQFSLFFAFFILSSILVY
jgi:hypothetical protein